MLNQVLLADNYPAFSQDVFLLCLSVCQRLFFVVYVGERTWMLQKAQTGSKKNRFNLPSRKRLCEGERLWNRGEVWGQKHRENKNRKIVNNWVRRLKAKTLMTSAGAVWPLRKPAVSISDTHLSLSIVPFRLQDSHNGRRLVLHRQRLLPGDWHLWRRHGHLGWREPGNLFQSEWARPQPVGMTVFFHEQTGHSGVSETHLHNTTCGSDFSDWIIDMASTLSCIIAGFRSNLFKMLSHPAGICVIHLPVYSFSDGFLLQYIRSTRLQNKCCLCFVDLAVWWYFGDRHMLSCGPCVQKGNALHVSWRNGTDHQQKQPTPGRSLDGWI